jgi:hypothetical protein
MSGLDTWVASWRAAVAAANSHGTDPSRPNYVIVGPPATEHELKLVEAEINMPIPAGLRGLLAATRSVDAYWNLPDGVAMPKGFEDISHGECSWSVGSLAEIHRGYRGWVERVFANVDDPYDEVWHAKFPFLRVGNGDIVAIGQDGRVVYLSHDDGEGHGFLLGADVEDFLDRWTAIGCPGPEDACWLPFVEGWESYINPNGDAATQWRRWFGLPG